MKEPTASEIGRSGDALDDCPRPRFAEVARAEVGALYSLARRLTDDDPEDLVQECLLRAFRAYDSLRNPAAAGRWLRAILVNAFRDRLRKRGRGVQEAPLDGTEENFSLYRTIAEEDPFPYSDSLHLDFLACFEDDDVRAVLLRLPPLYREPLVLRYMEGLATKEVARMLDVPLGTALARLHRGRKLLEKEMWAYAKAHHLLDHEEVAR
jgi:RNA polymerase sigma-70 factor (ECF subfamily)